MVRTRPLKFFLPVMAAFFLFCPPASAVSDAGQIVLEADRVEFDQVSGFAVATGSVRISRDLIRVFAPRVEYSAKDHTIEASSVPGKKVVLLHGPQRLEGEFLTLDMISGEGLFQNASGSFPPKRGRSTPRQGCYYHKVQGRSKDRVIAGEGAERACRRGPGLQVERSGFHNLSIGYPPLPAGV